MRPRAGGAREGILASLLLHLAAAAVLLYGASAGPARTLPVIDLTLLPSLAAGTAEAARPASGGERRTARKEAWPAAPSPSPAPPRDDAPGKDAPVPAPAEPRNGARTPAALPAIAPSPGASSPASASATGPSSAAPSGAASPGDASPDGAGGPGALSAPPSAASGVVSTMPGYDYLRDAIQREASYPPVARRMGWEGRVVVAFVIRPNGTVRDIRVVRGSGHEILDRNAVEAVRSASPFPHPPAEAEVHTPVVYRLE